MICKIRVRNFNPIQFQVQATCPVVLQLAVLMLHFICSHLWFTSRKRLDGGNPTIAILIYCRCVTDTYKIYLDNWGAPAIPKGWSTFFNLQAAHNMRKFILPQPLRRHFRRHLRRRGSRWITGIRSVNFNCWKLHDWSIIHKHGTWIYVNI